MYMDFGQLEKFLAVARTENISKAAVQLQISQPNLSNTLTRLEEQIGVPLFERKKGKISLTRSGRFFADYAERAIRCVTTGIIQAQEAAATETVRMVTSYPGILSELMRDFLFTHPQTITCLEVKGAVDCVKAVSNLESEFALIPFEPWSKNDDNIEFIHLFDEQLLLMLWEDHPLAAFESVTISMLQNEKLLCYNTSVSNEEIFGLCQKFSFTPLINLSTNDPNLVLESVQANQGLCIFSDLSFHRQQLAASVGCRILPISGAESVRAVGIAVKNDFPLSHFPEHVKSTIAEQLLDYAKAYHSASINFS